MSPTLAALGDAPDAVPVCAAWLHAEWGADQGYALSETQGWLRGIAAGIDGEQGVVALSGDEPVGVGLLVACDLEARPDLTPWISSLYVPPDRRGMGIATAILGDLVARAGAAGHDSVYLYTRSAEALYVRCGWRRIETLDVDGRDFALMRREL